MAEVFAYCTKDGVILGRQNGTSSELMESQNETEIYQLLLGFSQLRLEGSCICSEHLAVARCNVEQRRQNTSIENSQILIKVLILINESCQMRSDDSKANRGNMVNALKLRNPRVIPPAPTDEVEFTRREGMYETSALKKGPISLNYRGYL